MYSDVIACSLYFDHSDQRGAFLPLHHLAFQNFEYVIILYRK